MLVLNNNNIFFGYQKLEGFKYLYIKDCGENVSYVNKGI